MSDKIWSGLHKHYSTQDWIDIPNIFAEEVLEYLPKQGKVLCLGDGQGQDGRFFAQKGYEVTSTDISKEALKISEEKANKENLKNISVETLDLREPFLYKDNSFDVVYAHLSLHYFSEEQTKNVFKEIRRVLKKGGIVCVFTNSVNDPEFNTGKRLEQEYFEIDGFNKRFFSKFSMDYFTKDFQVLLLDDQGKTCKDEAKGVHNLIRFVGKNYPRKVDTIALPFVSAIVEREKNSETEVLIQKRWRPGSKNNYHDTIEIPAGVLDQPFENVLDAAKREVKEETGLDVVEIKDLKTSKEYSPNNDLSFAFKPFTCSQQLKRGLPWIGFTFICKVKDNQETKFQEDETRDIRWIKKSELKKMFETDKKQFFTLHLGTLEFYLYG
jgi:SAM-dependent methyltransferase